MRRLRLITRLTPFLFLLLVSGCRSVKETTQVRTEYENVYQRDSVWVDCTDTFFVEKNGDTVRILEKITEKEYHYTVYRDTLRSRDTLVVEKTITSAAASYGVTRKPRRFMWFFVGLCVGIALFFIIKILLKIFLKR